MKIACDHCSKVKAVNRTSSEDFKTWLTFEFNGTKYNLCPECKKRLGEFLEDQTEFETGTKGTDKMPKVGDLISFTLTDGREVQALAVKQDGKAMMFCMYECIEDHAMNNTDTTKGGWFGSDMCKWMNTELIKLFPDELVKRMQTVDAFVDKLRLPSMAEIFGDDGDDSEQWEPMKDIHKRVAKDKGEDCTAWYWLLDVYSPSGFYAASGHGYASRALASSVVGVRPVFSLIY